MLCFPSFSVFFSLPPILGKSRLYDIPVNQRRTQFFRSNLWGSLQDFAASCYVAPVVFPNAIQYPSCNLRGKLHLMAWFLTVESTIGSASHYLSAVAFTPTSPKKFLDKSVKRHGLPGHSGNQSWCVAIL
ncbi:hypothetical protein FB446DRAFT_507658 [Lentinula raphanica]|nr:hypothetical protein FB446DRAFT_507658 [Lentinula raphanica]